MSTFTELRDKLARFDAGQVVSDVYDQTNDALVSLNKTQLELGLTTEDGLQFGDYRPYAWKQYEEEKYFLNSLPGKGNPDLKYTGAFYNSIKAEVVNATIQVGASDFKAPQLEKWYGADKIYGLNDSYRSIHVEENIEPVFIIEIERATGLKME